MGLLASYSAPGGRWSVVIEDDHRVAYAYLREDEKVIGDVWLYNRERAPAEPEWREGPGAAPFLNAAEYVGNADVAPIASETDVRIEWDLVEAGQLRAAQVIVNAQHLATVAPHAKPGWCRHASKDSPVARVLAPLDEETGAEQAARLFELARAKGPFPVPVVVLSETRAPRGPDGTAFRCATVQWFRESVPNARVFRLKLNEFAVLAPKAPTLHPLWREGERIDFGHRILQVSVD